MAPNTSNSVTKTVKSTKEEAKMRTRIVNAREKSLDETSSPNLSTETEKVTNEHQNKVFTPQIRWPDLLAQVFVHGGCLYGLYYLITLQAKFYTYVWCKFVIVQSFKSEALSIFSVLFSSRGSGLRFRHRNNSRFASWNFDEFKS